MRILIADDNPDARELLAEALKNEPYQVDFAVSGESAIVKFALAEMQGEYYAVLILDIALPEMSGLKVGEKIRAGGFQTPIVFFTAYPGAVVEARAKLVTSLPVLEKPFEMDELRAAIEGAINSQQKH